MTASDFRIAAVVENDAGRLMPGYVVINVASAPDSVPRLIGGDNRIRVHEDRIYEVVEFGRGIQGDVKELMSAGRYPVEWEGEPSGLMAGVFDSGTGVSENCRLDLSDRPIGRAMRADAVDLLMIEGRLHVRTGGPVCRTSGIFLSDPVLEGRGAIEWVSGVEGMMRRRALAIRLDQVDEELAAIGIDPPEYRPRMLMDLSSLDLPDTRALAFDAMAYEALAVLGSTGLADMSYELLDAVHDLRRHLRGRDGEDPVSNPRRQHVYPIFDIFRPADASGLRDRMARILSALGIDRPTEVRERDHRRLRLMASRYPEIAENADTAFLGGLAP